MATVSLTSASHIVRAVDKAPSLTEAQRLWRNGVMLSIRIIPGLQSTGVADSRRFIYAPSKLNPDAPHLDGQQVPDRNARERCKGPII